MVVFVILLLWVCVGGIWFVWGVIMQFIMFVLVMDVVYYVGYGDV